MKKILLSIVAVVATATAFAQSKSQVQYQETQARLLDITSNAYVRPLTVELKIKGEERIRETVTIPKDIALSAMKGDPSNWRSYAVYEVSRRKNCDVIVAATFNILFDEVRGDKDVSIEVVGYPADFVNWQTLTKEDYEWVRMEKTITTAERDKIAAVIKEPTK